MARAIPVLMYHHVSPEPGLVTVSPETFASQMEYLASEGYKALSSDEFAACLAGRQEIPPKSVLITFDDGYLDNYVYAYPVLKRLGLRAIIFAVTGWVGEGDTRPNAGLPGNPSLPPCPSHRECKKAISEGRADAVMLRWSEVRGMEASRAIEVHSHTHSHIRWDKEYADPDARLGAVSADLEQSRRALQMHTGHDSTHLCWPWGYYEEPYLAAAVQAGFHTIYTVAKGTARPGTDPLRVPRIVIKDKPLGWFRRRLWIYSRPLLASIYGRIRGD